MSRSLRKQIGSRNQRTGQLQIFGPCATIWIQAREPEYGLNVFARVHPVGDLRVAERAGLDEVPRYGSPVLVRPRLGQGAFRVSVTEAYDRACAITREHSLPALEAVHIRPFAKEGPHEVRNGLLLRADLHRLFEQGYMTVTPDYVLNVSDRLRDDYHNGKSYYPLRGTRISVPDSEVEQPTRDLLEWHNQNVFLQ